MFVSLSSHFSVDSSVCPACAFESFHSPSFLLLLRYLSFNSLFLRPTLTLSLPLSVPLPLSVSVSLSVSLSLSLSLSLSFSLSQSLSLSIFLFLLLGLRMIGGANDGSIHVWQERKVYSRPDLLIRVAHPPGTVVTSVTISPNGYACADWDFFFWYLSFSPALESSSCTSFTFTSLSIQQNCRNLFL